jgi:NADP-dependent 3-hydroxy acid dehydrogenase YdfG
MKTTTFASESSLTDRIAVVTGASSGIGAATARTLAARGARIAVIARRADRLNRLVAEIRSSGGTANSYSADITDMASLKDVASRIRTELGAPGILINNAGVMLPAPVAEQRSDDWSRMIDLNVTALVNAVGVFSSDLFAAAVAQGTADLINISSIGATGVFPNFAVYCATKAAVSHLSRNLRTEFGPKQVRVSTFEPGLVETELADHGSNQAAKDWIFGARKAFKVLQSEDVAEVIAFTVSRPAHVNLDHIGIQPTAQV